MSVAGVHKLWNFFLTALRAVRAAACERAAYLIPDGARNIAGEGQAFFFIKGAFRRDRGEQRLSVRVLRICVDSLRSVELHDTSQIHDHDPVADVLDDAEVMGDENISQVKLLLQAAEEVDDLCLSSADTGSSQTMIFGSMERARAMFTRCLWPPENSWG